MNITYAVLLVIAFTGLGLFGASTIFPVNLMSLLAIVIGSFGLGWISNVQIEK